MLGAVGVLTGTPKWLLDPIMRNTLAPGLELPTDDDVTAWLGPTDLAVLGRQSAALFEFSASHIGVKNSGPASIQLMRLPEDGGHVIADFRLAPGGFLRWTAAYGHEIYGPVRIVTPDIVQTQVIGTDVRGRLVAASKNGVFPLHA